MHSFPVCTQFEAASQFQNTNIKSMSAGIPLLIAFAHKKLGGNGL